MRQKLELFYVLYIRQTGEKKSLCHHIVLKNAGDYKNAASQPVKVCIRFSLTESEVER